MIRGPDSPVLVGCEINSEVRELRSTAGVGALAAGYGVAVADHPENTIVRVPVPVASAAGKDSSGR